MLIHHAICFWIESIDLKSISYENTSAWTLHKNTNIMKILHHENNSRTLSMSVEIKRSSNRQRRRHWYNRKLLFRRLTVQPVTRIDDLLFSMMIAYTHLKNNTYGQHLAVLNRFGKKYKSVIIPRPGGRKWRWENSLVRHLCAADVYFLTRGNCMLDYEKIISNHSHEFLSTYFIEII